MKEKYVQVSKAVVKVLWESSAFDGVLKLPKRDLGKKLYGEVKRVLEMADGKWDARKKAFVFTRNGFEQIASIIRTGKVFHRKQVFQEFFTPTGLADKLAELVTEAWRFKELKNDTFRVLEPSAGIGNLVDAIISCYDFGQDIEVTACEIQEENLRRIPVDDRVHTVHGDFLASVPNVSSSENDGCGYHAILMNPPFDKNAWIQHVRHAMGYMLKGGVLVAVVPRTASLEDLNLKGFPRAFLTPVKTKFGGTGVKVSILTIGVSRGTLEAVLKDIIENVVPFTEPTEKLRSPEYYLREIQRLNKQVERTLNELERELRECRK